MKDIGAHVRYIVLWGRVSKLVRARVQMCHNPAVPLSHVRAVLSGTPVVRVLCMVMASPCCAVVRVIAGVSTECARLRLTAPGSASTKCLYFLIMPKRRGCAKSVSASNNELNMW